MKSKSSLLLILAIVTSTLATMAIPLAHAQTGSVTLKPTDDTYVDSNAPDSNHGRQTYLEISDWEGFSTDYRSIVWLKFNLSSLPDGAVVDAATLQLYTSLVGETFNVHAYSSDDNSWSELTMTYANMPDYNLTSMSSTQVATNNQWYSWNVVDDVRNALNGNPKSVTMVMQEPAVHRSASFVWFYSKEAPVYFTDYSPILLVHWSSVVPEFSTFLILSFFMMTTLIAVTFYRKKTFR